MHKYLLLFFIIAICELVLTLLFAGTAQWYYKKLGFDLKSIFKGIIERGFLFLMLVNDYPHALTLFSALKLGTRLKHKELEVSSENKFNDYYLIGNLVSVSFAVFYVYLYNHLHTIPLLQKLID